jgi:hypothetical protein
MGLASFTDNVVNSTKNKPEVLIVQESMLTVQSPGLNIYATRCNINQAFLKPGDYANA